MRCAKVCIFLKALLEAYECTGWRVHANLMGNHCLSRCLSEGASQCIQKEVQYLSLKLGQTVRVPLLKRCC